MRRSIISLCVSIALIAVGTILCSFEFLNFKIVDNFEEANLSNKKMTYALKLNGDNNVIDTSETQDNEILYDDTLVAGNIRLEVIYYDELISIRNYTINENNENIFYIERYALDDFKAFRRIFRATIDGLKKNNIYDYPNAIKPKLKIYINESDKDFVKIR